MADTPSLLSKSPEYAALEPARTLARDLMGGTRAVRAKGTVYLPKWEAEEEGQAGVKGYQRRLHCAVLEPFYEDAVLDLTGRVFSRPILVKDDVPVAIRGDEEAGVDGFWELIDNAQFDGHEFFRRVLQAAIAEGECGILAEHTPPPLGRTRADELAVGARPYLVRIDSANILDVVRTTEGGKQVLTYVKIREEDRIEGEGKNQKAIPRVRKLFRGNRAAGTFARFEVWELRKDEAGNEVEFLTQEQGEMRPQIEIPFVRFRTREDGAPPLEGLAHDNVRYFQVESQLDNNLFAAAVPIFTVTGIDPSEGSAERKAIEGAGVGAARLWLAQRPEATFNVLEMEGKIAKVLEDRLAKLEQRMRRQAREPLLPRTGDRTATEAGVEEARAHSLLESWAIALEDRAEEALGFMALYLGEKSGGSLGVNRRFGFAGNAPELLGLVIKMRERGDVSRETLWEVGQMVQAFPDTFDPEVETERLENEKPLGGLGAEEELRAKVADLEGWMQREPMPEREEMEDEQEEKVPKQGQRMRSAGGMR